MYIPAVIAHGGAGPGPKRKTNLDIAVNKASIILKSGGSAIDAAVEACVILENDPVFNAGTGGVFRIDGSVQLDASIQTCDGRIGFIIAIENTPNPIKVAKALLDEEINGLTGDGARKWADERGFVNSPVEGREPVEGMGDTIGVIARDKNGLFACATSTGGCSYRPPGRVGDVPLPGSGFWTKKGISVAATGNGEEITKKLLSYRVLEKISNSNFSLIEGMNWGLDELIDNSKSVGLIALKLEGVGMGVANTDMPWSSWIGS
ncbi:MAG: isoaspartyl peptidase/L-asparaginase [Candidatus Thalassarchaeaceae archaeon]|nr:isoaspartyl peptidase/L-asparaginase [Candidatus Thalassarchaeaceae archaeon]